MTDEPKASSQVTLKSNPRWSVHFLIDSTTFDDSGLLWSNQHAIRLTLYLVESYAAVVTGKGVQMQCDNQWECHGNFRFGKRGQKWHSASSWVVDSTWSVYHRPQLKGNAPVSSHKYSAYWMFWTWVNDRMRELFLFRWELCRIMWILWRLLLSCTSLVFLLLFVTRMQRKIHATALYELTLSSSYSSSSYE